MKAVRNRTLVLAVYPHSAAYRAKLDGMLGADLVHRSVSELMQSGKGAFLRHLARSPYRRVVVSYEVAGAASVLPILNLIALAHRFPRVEVCDPEGNLRRVHWGEIAAGSVKLACASAAGFWAAFRSGRRARSSIKKQRRRLPLGEGPHRVLYLNNSVWFGLHAGGSVGHVAGVINGLVHLGHQVRLVSPMPNPYLDASVGVCRVPALESYGFPPAANLFRMQKKVVRAALDVAREFKPTLVYQRLTLGDWSGVEVADALGVPLVVEYNGSELWIVRNWRGREHFGSTMMAAEEAILKRADMVFTISRPLYEELLNRQIEPARAAWYPNCVDAAVYNPAAIGEESRRAARTRLGGGERDYVITFIGTFGVWHGAEVFARAVVRLASDEPWVRRHQVRFAFVGDGKTRPETEEIIRKEPSAAARTVFAGLVPQHEGPRYLAASDAFVASHVPNADGSKFFGSPTKLFEYMAMARPIVASALDQIAEVLDHERTALLTQPGDVESLAAGLRRVVEDRTLGARLGAAARAEVLARFTWTRHVSVMLDALERACVTDARKGGK
jgi:glycosyltransferase involved in cell wall biosynthesis